MLIRDYATSYRLEIGTDDAGKVRFIIHSCHRKRPCADEEDQLAWLLRELRRLDVSVVVPGADMPAAVMQ